MFTKNFWTILESYIWTKTTSTLYEGLKDLDGASVKVAAWSQYSRQPGSMVGAALLNAKCTTSYKSAGVYFGTDATPATRNDYKLGSIITSGLSIANPSNLTKIENAEEDSEEYSATYSVTNTSEADVNIYEIGVHCGVINGTGSEVRYSLMERTVLTEPITIPAGQAKVVTYKIKLRKVLALEG